MKFRRAAKPAPKAGDSAISIRNLVFERGHRAIFDHVDIEIPRGKITAIMGPSGTGKTTLLGLVTGQLHPSSGQICIEGIPVHSLRARELFALRMRMGMLFQNGALLTELSAFENVAFPLREHTDFDEHMIRTLVLMKLESVGLRGAANLMPAELSGGMARRIALARAIVFDPEFVFYDEPFTGLDPISLSAIVRLIRHLHDALGLTTVIVSHDVDILAHVADESYLIAEGKVVARGTPDEIRRNRSQWVQQFIGGLNEGPVPFHYPSDDYAHELLDEEEG